MGQYYSACVLSKNKREVVKGFRALTCGSSGKLVEHAWLGDIYVSNFEYVIDADRKDSLAGNPVVWCGDYADSIKKYFGEEESSHRGDDYPNWYDLVVSLRDEEKLSEKPEGSVLESVPTEIERVHRRYIINLSKELFVDTYKCEAGSMHPLPLLICSGNGRGGGDYYGTSMSLIGSWAGDIVVVSDRKPEEFSEIIPNFDMGGEAPVFKLAKYL